MRKGQVKRKSSQAERKEASMTFARRCQQFIAYCVSLLKQAVYVDFKGLRNIRTLFSVITAIL